MFSKRAIGLLSAILVSTPVTANEPADPGWDPILTQLFDQDRERYLAGPTIEVPEVYELATIILLLTPGGQDLVVDSEYRREVLEHFSPYADHEIVRLLDFHSRERDLVKAYEFRENAYIYCFEGENDFLVRCQPFSHVWGRQANNFSRNVALIRDFALKSGFREFYAAHKDYYEGERKAWHDAVDPAQMTGWLEARFSNRVNYLAIVFSPLVRGWHSTQGFGDGDFVAQVLFLQAIGDYADEFPWVPGRIIFTEIDHGYVNPVSAGYFERLGRDDSFGGTFWYDAGVATYSNGFSVFNEYMTWALFELWARDSGWGDRMPELSAHMDDFMVNYRKFPHYTAFRDQLFALYDAHGDETPQIADLYPALLDWAEVYRGKSGSAAGGVT